MNGVAFSPDGKRIVTGSQDNTVKVWDAETGLELLTLKGHTNVVFAVAFSPDGKRLVTGSWDRTAKVWDAATSQEVLVLQGHTDMVTRVAFSPDGKRIFAWDTQNKVLAWSAADGKPTDPANPPPAPPLGPARSPDGFRRAVPEGKSIAVTEKRPPPKDNAWPLPDAAERKAYHTEQAALAVQQKQWFAAEFHLGRVLRDDPKNAAVKTRLAQIPFMIAYVHKKFTFATRLWAEALESDPKLGDDRKTLNRDNAARAAVMAAAEQGHDESPLDDATKAKLRRQAHDWLKAVLTASTKLLESGPPQDRASIVHTLSLWQQHSDLAGIRDTEALAKLPKNEGAAFSKLWADVAELLKIEPRSVTDPKLFAGLLATVAPGFTTAAVGEGGLELLKEHFGRPFVIRTHPIKQGVPCILNRTVELPAGVKSKLWLTVAHDARGDWQLIVKANGQKLHDSIIGPRTTNGGWADVEIDLARFAGEKVNLELHNHPNNWFSEWGYWGRVEIPKRALSKQAEEKAK